MGSIQLTNIQKKWGEFWGVRDFNLEISHEEFIVLLGPSGCGKTTTMRMIAGLENPTEGEIRMDGEVVNDIDPRDRDVAMVFQGYALYPNMTVYENIRFPLRMRGVPKSEQRNLVNQAAELVELTEFLDRKPSALSGGQRQRAALARAIVRQPQVFLMDEPLSNLDAKLRQTMRVQIKHIQRELKITTVYVTHDQVEAMTLADRIVIMNSGVIQQIGSPQEIYSDPANSFVAGFIGSPPMNLIEGKVSAGVFSTEGVNVDNLPVACNGVVLIGIRPEDCRIVDDMKHAMGTVYGVEPTGDVTYVTIKVGGMLFEVKSDRECHAEINQNVYIEFDTARLYVFDSDTGLRLK